MIRCASFSSGETAVASSSTVSSPAGAFSCGKNPIVADFSVETLPASGDASPRIREKSVDLPAPFGPDQPHAIAAIHLKRRVFEERAPGKGFGDLRDREHCAAGAQCRRRERGRKVAQASPPIAPRHDVIKSTRHLNSDAPRHSSPLASAMIFGQDLHPDPKSLCSRETGWTEVRAVWNREQLSKPAPVDRAAPFRRIIPLR